MAKQKVSVSFDKNEIHTEGRAIAGVLLVVFTVLPIIFIVGLFPDQMPAAGEKIQLYAGQLFNMRLVSNLTDYKGPTIHLNTIMFFLVALAGFMGSMIHLATSFTNYVGSEKFKRSWILWYFVKPFTGAAIAIVFYLVLKAGLLNSDGASGVNPYGIIILAALAGLFTDKATMKLEEIFTVIFKPKDDRPDKLDETSIKIKGIEPKKLSVDGDNNILIKGEALDKHPLSIKINDTDIPAFDVKPDAISFKFKIPDEFKTEKALRLSVFDKAGKSVYNSEIELDIKQEENTGEVAEDDMEEDTEEEAVTEGTDQFVKG